MCTSSHIADPEYLFLKTVVSDDEKAFEKLFELFYSPLSVYAKKYIDERTLREDIVQDVFASLWEDRKRLSITSSVRNYLIVSVRNGCLNHLHREGLSRRYQEFLSTKHLDADNEDVYLLTELQELLNKALAKLPATYRIVFEMHHMEGKDYNEIAATLNISVRTAKRYKSQVVEVLKEELKDYLTLLALIYPNL